MLCAADNAGKKDTCPVSHLMRQTSVKKKECFADIADLLSNFWVTVAGRFSLTDFKLESLPSE
jgi:hypothetical protein